MSAKYLPRQNLEDLFAKIAGLGYRVLGPKKRDNAIVYDNLTSVDELAMGWQDEQEGGHYRLLPTNDSTLFSYVVGPDSWKKYLFPPRESLFKAVKQNNQLSFEPTPTKEEKLAFFGIRSCELAAIKVQDKVFLGAPFTDPAYASRRKNLLLVAVNCSRSAGTCFCSSLETGPKAKSGFDLALTEVNRGREHYFLLEVGSPLGHELVRELDLKEATDQQMQQAAEVSRAAAAQQKRSLNTNHLKEKLENHLDNNAFWSDVAQRCLSCGNCTLVCPTCFCSTVEDITDLEGGNAERVRYWDSCFNASHSDIVGGCVRQSGQSRYRQWLTHKLGTWQDQFGTLGCIGCGRCISWCPVGIDLTAEADRLNSLGDNIIATD